MYFSILLAGFAGGLVRGLVGFVKHQFSYKNVKFELFYFLAMMFLSGIIGLVSSFAIKSAGVGFSGMGIGLALIVGYAGGDFLENIYKIIIKKSSLYPGEDSKD